MLIELIEDILGESVEYQGQQLRIATDTGWRDINEDESKTLENLYPNKYKKFMMDRLASEVQEYLDTTAQSYGFDNIMSARSYAGYLNEYQEVAGRLAQWAANVWHTIESNADRVQSREDLFNYIKEFKNG